LDILETIDPESLKEVLLREVWKKRVFVPGLRSKGKGDARSETGHSLAGSLASRSPSLENPQENGVQGDVVGGMDERRSAIRPEMDALALLNLDT